MRYVIIGGVAGGATAAARLRRADELAEIILLEKGPHISYANCGLPYYIGGVIVDRAKLLLQTPESFGKRFRIDASGEEYTESYDKLLLSPGANPAYIAEKQVKRAVVVGAGFIGLEMAESLHRAGVAISVVEMGNQVMAPIDFSMAAYIHQHLTQKGVSLYLEESVTHFHRTESGLIVFLKSGNAIPADMVLLSIGVRPSTELAQQAGLRLGETGGIWVDEHLETSQKDIYAVGDAIEYPHPLTKKPWLNYLANPANRQGRIVADNMVFGNTVSYEGAIGTSIAKVFDMTVASTGLAAKRLKQLGMEYQSSVTHSSSHAGYYPGALPLTLKLIYHPTTGKLYGAQCVGYEGVDKRIDQIAGLIKHGGTVYNLKETEHSYAPPYSSAKDPIAIGGYVACNIIGGAMPAISWRELVEEQEKVMIIDVRTVEEYSFSSIPARDAAAWCDATGNQLIEKHEEKGRYTIILEKVAPTVISNSTL
ncbi:FAD/NAD(P)-binding domain-containing protein [Basidiobolus meristosporus CBS 931.73]|uniref:FAD/NAD(P)-binding domain-containing protein n=1 Tax=Basidiobolus meristosporus CBS 931.73 TaxID=1314790 RepID=A0A1Y1XSH8_9FUNG|nr:FAD/NAD(P)-binding domain-containing protein [Basidiobolus meristosporus CBS 931.73]|eukprot:ORX88688.1 FAD/NAD(P)-binding domain-containing protein [Basidiobolus meristosporus CBS 931.73]